MIDIIVNGKSLAIPSDITLTMEQTAPWSDPDNVLSDIIYTFDIPAEPNAAILDHAQSTLVSHHRKYPCQVLFGSMPIADGQLYVQTTQDELHLSCGITFNPFGLGWGEKKLTENDYGEAVEIVHNGLESFKQDWRNFLKESLSDDSNLKFFLFCSESFSEDDDFGFYRNTPSSLENVAVSETDPSRFYQYVNRLFYDSEGNIIEYAQSIRQGLRIFNSDSGAANGHKVNGYRFAPALRLVWMTQRILASAGKRLTGEWSADARILNLFAQSLCSMDGDVRQYPVVRTVTLQNVAAYSSTQYGNACLPFRFGSSEYDTFRPYQNSSTSFPISYQLLLPVDDLAHGVTGTVPAPNIQEQLTADGFNQYDEAYFLAIAPSIETLNGYLSTYNSLMIGHTSSRTALVNCTSYYFQPSTVAGRGYELHATIVPDVQFLLLTSINDITVPNDNDDIGGYTMTTNRAFLAVQKYLTGSRDMHLFVVKGKVFTSETTFDYYLTAQTGYSAAFNGTNSRRGDVVFVSEMQLVDTSTIDYNDTPLNIFSKNFDISQHLPNLTNAQYLAQLARLFGLSMWIGSDTDVQLDFFKSVFKSDAIDLDDYIYSAKKENYEPKRYKASLTPMLSKSSVRDDYKLDPIDTREDLPDANMHKNRHIFVTSENCYLRSARQRDSSGVLTSRYGWEQAGATDSTLQVGDSDQESTEYTPSAQIPNMCIVDQKGTKKYLQEIPATGCSPMFDDDYNGEFPLVITQNRGNRSLQIQSSTSSANTHQSAYIQYANPTNYNEDGTTDTDYINLTATGENSVGELWLRPYLQFLATSEPFEFTARVPINIFFSMLNLMRPQESSIAKQVRWITHRQQRFLPSRITYSITSADTVVATITCYRELLTQE